MKGKCTIDNPNRSTKQFLKSRLPLKNKIMTHYIRNTFSLAMLILKKNRGLKILSTLLGFNCFTGMDSVLFQIFIFSPYHSIRHAEGIQ